MDLTWMKEAGLPTSVAVIVGVFLLLGQNILAILKSRVDQAPAMVQARSAAQAQTETAAGAVLNLVLTRLTEIERQLGVESANSRACEKRYAALDRRFAAVCAVLRDHKIEIPADALDGAIGESA